MDNYSEHLIASAKFFAYAFTELAVLFIGISFLVGVLTEFITPAKVQKWLSGKGGRGYFIGAALGGLTPFCSCSSIPIMVGLLRARAGFGPTMSFLFSSPLVNPVIVGLFVTMLGLRLAGIYTLIALAMAVCAGLILNRLGFDRYIKSEAFGLKAQPVSLGAAAGGELFPTLEAAPAGSTSTCCGTGAPKAAGRWKRIFRESVQQFRTFLPLVALGVAVGAFVHGFVPADLLAAWAGPDNLLAVPAAAVIGVPLYVRASTMIPIASSLVAKGLSLGTMMALIIGGAGASLPEMIMLKGLFKGPLLAAFIITVMTMAVLAGYLFNVIG